MESESLVELTVGDVVKAIVKDVSKNYAILSIGDVDAILPSIEYNWNRINDLEKELHIGEDLQSVVIQITDQGVMLSVKRLQKDPWKGSKKLYKVGLQTKGKVVKVVGIGAFIELTNGIVGLLMKEEMSLDGLSKPNEVVLVGQEIDVMISSINRNERKMFFTIKPFISKNS